MPLDTVRLLDSDMFALSSGEEFKAAFALWCKSWQQVPAASLPNDDRILAHLSGAGHRWCDIRDMSLRGWILCSDGRLYHPVVAEKAMEALPRRKEYRDKKSNDAQRKERERQDRKNLFAALKAIGIVPEFNIRTSELRALAVTHNVTDASVTDVTPVTNHVTAKTGTGTGTGIYSSVAKATAADAAEPPSVQVSAETQMWNAGKAFLIKRGVTKTKAGEMLGKWKGQYGVAATIEALGVAELEPNLVDPISFIQGVFRKRQGNGGGTILPGGCTPIGSPC